MEIRSLRYAITLAEELHFGRAAQRHYIGAQPFGRHIQNLERELGVQLFERTSRRVALTPEGTRVLAEARAIVDAVDALTDARR
ncbi:LysR family transcriptional regulator [Actinoallomurus sp. CA-150999]|uniref:LysR family transcriptional regulator n=1 Tax=Actinoallomurus sp. CA-150999 TaxID=3239887 RepID=UPI003D8ED0AD